MHTCQKCQIGCDYRLVWHVVQDGYSQDTHEKNKYMCVFKMNVMEAQEELWNRERPLEESRERVQPQAQVLPVKACRMEAVRTLKDSGGCSSIEQASFF